MLKLFENVFLLERNQEEGQQGNIEIISKFPDDIQVEFENKDLFYANSNPKFDFTGENQSKSIFFVFNINKTYFYSFTFYFESKIYSIIISSLFPFAYLYSSFFKEAEDMFMKENFNDPQLRFAYITSLIQTWNNKYQNTIEVTFPSGPTKVSLIDGHFNFSQYNPSCYFSHNELMKIYYSFIHNEPILLISKDACEGTLVSLSLFSLLAPLQYCGPFAIWMTSEDKRIENIDQSGLLFVCSNDIKLENNEYFKLVLRIPENQLPPKNDYKTSVLATTKYLASLYGTELDTQLLEDPWSDTLYFPLNLERTKKIAIEGYGMPFDNKAALAFNNSETWKLWRKRLKWRNEWMEAMKSSDPSEIMKKHPSKEERDLIKETIAHIPEDIQADKHLMAVIKKYKKIIDSAK